MSQKTGTNNVFLNDELIIKNLVADFVNQLQLAKLAYRPVDRYYASGKGETINIGLPIQVESVDGPDITSSIKPIVENQTSITIGYHKTVPLQITVRDRSLSMRDFRERVSKPAAQKLVNDLETDLGTAMINGIGNSSGTPGSDPTISDFHMTKAYMSQLGIPDSPQRNAVLNSIDSALITNEVKGLYADALVQKAIKVGYTGDLAMFHVFDSGILPNHTVGAYGGTPLVNGASQDGSTITTDGWTLSTQVLNKGDVVAFAGVYSVNPITKQSTGRLAQFVVTADVTSDGAGAASIPISPSLTTSSTTTTDGSGTSVSKGAYQNVSGSPADNAAITVLGTASTTYRQNLLFHKHAVALAVPTLYQPESATVRATAYDNQFKVGLSLTEDYDILTHKEILRVDLLYGIKVIRPEFGFRLWGDNL